MTLDETTSTTDRPNGHDGSRAIYLPSPVTPAEPATAVSSAAPRDVNELARIANEALGDIERLVAEAVKRAIVAGDALNEARALLRHGEWLPWLAKNFKGTARTAQRFMLLAALGAHMPDVLKEMPQHTIAGALSCLQTAFENRQKATGHRADVYTAEVARVWVRYGEVLNDARDGLGEEHWRLWLANLGITEEQAVIYIDISQGPANRPKQTWASVPGPVPPQILQMLKKDWAPDSPTPNTTASRISKKAVAEAKNEHARRATEKGPPVEPSSEPGPARSNGNGDDRPRRERVR